MNSNQILRSEIIDILFDNRNKAYGAYELRKHYNRRLQKAVWISLGLAILCGALSFLVKPVQKLTYITSVLDIAKLKAVNEIKEKEKKAQPKKENRAAVASAPIPTVPLIVDKFKKDSVKIPNIPFNSFVQFRPGNGTDSTGIYTGGGKDTTSIVVSPLPPVVKIPAAPMVYNNPDVYPQFPGGVEALRRFLEKNLNNPRDMEDGEAISVHVKFIVGEDGHLKSFEVLKDGGQEFNKEVIRVLQKMPPWIPGKSNGKDVAVYNIIPVKFVAAN